MKSRVVAFLLAMTTLAGLDPTPGKACAQAMGGSSVPLPHYPLPPKGEASISQPPLLTAACSGKLEQHTERRGVIYSPAWPLNYPPGTNCSWYIQGDRGDMITIRYGGPGGVRGNRCGPTHTECECDGVHVRARGKHSDQMCVHMCEHSRVLVYVREPHLSRYKGQVCVHV